MIRDILSTAVIMVDIRLNFLEQMVQAKKMIWCMQFGYLAIHRDQNNMAVVIRDNSLSAA